MSEKVEVESVTFPGCLPRVDKARYVAMAAIKPLLPQDPFPRGEQAGRWSRCVQLALAAKGVLVRAPKPPVRLWKA